jgi:hypothetical protein
VLRASGIEHIDYSIGLLTRRHLSVKRCEIVGRFSFDIWSRMIDVGLHRLPVPFNALAQVGIRLPLSVRVKDSSQTCNDERTRQPLKWEQRNRVAVPLCHPREHLFNAWICTAIDKVRNGLIHLHKRGPALVSLSSEGIYTSFCLESILVAGADDVSFSVVDLAEFHIPPAQDAVFHQLIDSAPAVPEEIDYARWRYFCRNDDAV